MSNHVIRYFSGIKARRAEMARIAAEIENRLSEIESRVADILSNVDDLKTKVDRGSKNPYNDLDDLAD